LNGYVAERGAALGVPVPVNRTLHALVKLLELETTKPAR
jgi:2-dehydropantoate 2-reductase